MTFGELVERMPIQLVGSFDALRHKTPADLARLAEHEIDLFDEGEESDIKTHRERFDVRAFLLMCLCSMDEQKVRGRRRKAK